MKLHKLGAGFAMCCLAVTFGLGSWQEPSAQAAGQLQKTYRLDNPTSTCSSALRVRAKGVNITSITRKGDAPISMPYDAHLPEAKVEWTFPCQEVGVVEVTVTADRFDNFHYWFDDCACG